MLRSDHQKAVADKEAQIFELKCDKNKLQEKLEMKVCELIQLRGQVGGLEVQGLKIELAVVKQQLFDRDASLKEWKQKEQGWLNMFGQVYNLSKDPSFYKDLKKALEEFQGSLQNSKVNSLHGSCNNSRENSEPIVQTERDNQQMDELQLVNTNTSQEVFDSQSEVSIINTTAKNFINLQERDSEDESIPEYGFNCKAASNCLDDKIEFSTTLKQTLSGPVADRQGNAAYAINSSRENLAKAGTNSCARRAYYLVDKVLEYPNLAPRTNTVETVYVNNESQVMEKRLTELNSKIYECNNCEQLCSSLASWRDHKQLYHMQANIYSSVEEARNAQYERKRERTSLLTKRAATRNDNLQYLKPRAQRKRELKVFQKKTKDQVASEDKAAQKLIGVFLKSIQSKVVTVEKLLEGLEQMHTSKKFEIVSDLFCDGIGITNIVFPTMAEFESFFSERGIHIYLVMRAWAKKEELVQQNTGEKTKRLFIRLKDENAIVTSELLKNLSRAMNDLRLKARQLKLQDLISQTQTKKLTSFQLSEIDKYVASVHLTKFDDTKDMRGCIYTEHISKVCRQLEVLLDYQKAVNYDSQRSCLQFIPKTNRLHKSMSNLDQRHKLYCKDLHLIQSVSNNKKISLGIAPILRSRVLRERMAKCNDTLMSRSEHTTSFKSVDDEQLFLNCTSMVPDLNKMHDSIIDIVNNSEMLPQLNCLISRDQLWQMYFGEIKETYIGKAGKYAIIVYAYKRELSKFVGLFGPTQLSLQSLASKYGAPGSICHEYTLINQESRVVQNVQKVTQSWQLPVLPYSWNNVELTLLQEIGVDVNDLFFKSSIKTYDVQFKHLSAENVFPDKEMEAQLIKKQAEKIEEVYSKHKAQICSIIQMNETSVINGCKFANGKLVLFDLNANAKFQDELYSKERFAFLEKLLVQHQHQLIQSMYVFINGLSYSQLNTMIDSTNKEHYEFVVCKQIYQDEGQAMKSQKRKENKTFGCIDKLDQDTFKSDKSVQLNNLVSQLPPNENSAIDNNLPADNSEGNVTALVILDGPRVQGQRVLYLKNEFCVFKACDKGGNYYQCSHCQRHIKRNKKEKIFTISQ